MTATIQHSHNHHHHHHRRWTWAHVQQSLRRNCLIGPVAFCLLTVLVLPHVLKEEHVVQHLPLVEAVPFFRRAKAIAFKRRRPAPVGVEASAVPTAVQVSGGASSSSEGSSRTALGAAAAIAEPETTTAATTNATEAEAEAAADNSSTTPTAENTNNKRKHAEISSDEEEYNFPLFVDADKFESDSKAAIPFRYFEAHQRKDDVARKAVLTSLEWRKQHQIDTILNRPQPNYDIAKRILPHYFIGRSAVTNHVVFVQRPGLADLPLAYHNGLELQDMLHQYAYVFEYCWNILHTNQQTTPEGDHDLMIGVMDLQGLNLSVLRKPDLINFVKEFVGMIDAHYPTRAYKTIMVNAPGWFSTLYKLISPIMRETTKEKIVLFSAGKAQTAALEEALGTDMATTLSEALRIPDKKERKSKAKNDLTLTSDILLDTPMEQEMRQFVMQRLEQNGLEMNKIEPLSS